MKKVTKSGKTAMKVGAGLVAATAAAAAGYYFYGSAHAKNHRKKVAKWATEMKQEVTKEVKRLEHASPKAVAAIVDRVAATYQAARTVDAAEVKRAAKELKEHWDVIRRGTKRTVRKHISPSRTVRKGVRHVG